uniref:MADS-box transcription factor 26 n=1 Tax=Paphiopedilum callosum TaxID=53075 RepID=A0A8F5SQI9_9ASPA|nr:MADS-box transcription factor 26 [Paphiopedilum callosum]
MARGKVQMRRIENTVHRQVTFCKRRAGLLKKAKELSVLCDADIGIIIFSTHGKLYELATNGTMHDLIQRYRNSCSDSRNVGDVSQPQEARQEATMLKHEIDLLQTGLRHMLGQAEVGNMTLEELHALESQLEIWMNHIRSAKMQMMFQEIRTLKTKEGVLKAANEMLQEKIEEQTGHFGIARMIVEQNGFFTTAPNIVDIPSPLTIQNEIFQF